MNDVGEHSLSMADSDEEEEEKEPMRCFNIKVKENGELHFLLKFTPNDAKSYNFELPIRLQGYGKIEGLTRFISCRGLRPRCILDPPTLEFKKKTITSFEKPLPDYEKVVLSNMDLTKTIVWKFDTKIIDEERAFTIHPTQGRIEPGQQQIITVGFSPNNPGQYEKVVPFYLDNDLSKPYGNLTLKGMGDFPKLLFDRKEIILPVVPLDVESRCTFKIINDGYENLTLKYEIANDVGNIDKNFLNLEFPEGKNLGVTKPKYPNILISLNLLQSFIDLKLKQYLDQRNHFHLQWNLTLLMIINMFTESESQLQLTIVCLPTSLICKETLENLKLLLLKTNQSCFENLIMMILNFLLKLSVWEFLKLVLLPLELESNLIFKVYSQSLI